MPTGGININNFKKWLDDGAFEVGIDSDLSNAYASGRESDVVKQCKKYVSYLKRDKI